MNHLERARDILPVLAALYALVMVTNLHAAPHPVHTTGAGIDTARVISGLKWHMLQMARAEQSEAFLSPGD